MQQLSTVLLCNVRLRSLSFATVPPLIIVYSPSELLSESQEVAKDQEKGESGVMRQQPSPSKDNRELSDEATREATVGCLQEHLELEVAGSKVTTEMVLEVLIHAASNGQSIEASCAELSGSAASNTLCEYVNAAFNEATLESLEMRVNQALVAQLPKKVRKHPIDVAIDLHDQAFYGENERLLSYASRGQAKVGTTYFYRIASIYLMLKGVRVTLGVVFVYAKRSLAECVTPLIKQVRALNIKLGCLFLDRGFASIDVYRCLQRRRIPDLIACPIRGKDKGTKALCQGRQSYTTRHTFHSAAQGNCTLTVVVVRAFTQTGQRGQRKHRQARWFLYILINLHLSPQTAHARYRFRFGIESSYRLLRQVRTRTNSRNPALRFLFMALALLLLNIWLVLRFRFCQLPTHGRAGRSLDEARFRLARFASFLSHAIERSYTCVCAIAASAFPIRG
jgi:Transposase DDE domain